MENLGIIEICVHRILIHRIIEVEPFYRDLGEKICDQGRTPLQVK
jgi:hypothetical protein